MIVELVNNIEVIWQFVCDFFFPPKGMHGEDLAIVPVVAAAAISAAASIANGIFGSKSASEQAKAQQKMIDRQRQEARNWRDRILNEDATQSAYANRILTRMDNIAKKRNLAAAGKRAVVGGTGATEAATQQANAEGMTEAIGNMYANEQQRRDAADRQYMQTKSALDAQELNNTVQTETAKRNAMAQAASGVVNTAASVLAAQGDGNEGGLKSYKPKVVKSSNNSAEKSLISTVEATRTKPTNIFDLGQSGRNDNWYNDEKITW